ncbi:Protein of unknown function DUF966 [Macleaya cordata]|uniref:SOSEKI DIX-like domain-containing protein n=1 Tax=Macleaya cordata TaxID=56857 RepID=A0A200PXZ5_MACCD|nr:Protein of unknown function DUF966 [Macleaya cordata]
MDVIRARATRNREISPERVKLYVQPKMKPFKKVQVLYYLCRNGQLEHPHFMEVTHLATQQLRLKDVIDRLTVLRGKIMPSLFSWSCKRSYKNGYVWNDLSENDVIYPAEGAEYILKGSEVIEGCAEKFQQLQVITNKQQNPEPNFHPKRRLHLVGRQHRELELEYIRAEDEEEDDEEEEEEEAEEKRSNSTSSNKSSSQRSRGVSTNEDLKTQINNPTEITLDDASPPSTSSTLSEKAQANNTNKNNSERFHEGHDSVTELTMTRSSALFQLITCGSSAAIKERNSSNMSGRKSCTSSLHKGVLCKNITATKMSENDEINYMSENPRFGNPQSEEKEYFSGSIVESMTEVNRVATEPSLKKSSSYNEERSSKSGLGEITTMEKEKVEEEKKKKGMKCIPRKMISSSFKQTTK